MMTSTNRRVFVDTSAFIALLVEWDPHHGTALSVWNPVAEQMVQFTTWGIVSETYTWLRVKAKDDRVASRWLDQVEAAESMGYLQVIWPDPATDRLARSILRRFSDTKLSYVDATSLAVLQMYSEIDSVFCFDEHLSLVGIPFLVTSGRE